MEIKDTTSLIEPFSEFIDFKTATLKDAKVHIKRNASVMRGYYADEQALEKVIEEQNDPLHYETFEGKVPEEYGQLLFGISKLQAGLIGNEYFMTKGHYHTIIETGEIYICLAGRGYMLMKTQAGEVRYQKMCSGSMVYVPPYWAHRSINTGDEPLSTFFIYQGDAGHNYGDIENEGFIKRVYKHNGSDVIE